MGEASYAGLRELLSQSPTRQAFRQVLACLAEDFGQEEQELALQYAAGHLESWPERERHSTKKLHPTLPFGWSLVRSWKGSYTELDKLDKDGQLDTFGHIKWLELEDAFQLCEKDFLPRLGHLEAISLHSCPWSICRGVLNLPRLKELRVGRTDDLQDTRPFAKLQQLELLDLSNNWGLRRLEGLASLPRLKRLMCQHMTQLTEIPALGAFPALESLNLYRCDEMAHLDGLEQVTTLRHLIGPSSVAFGPYRGWENLTQLKSLSFFMQPTHTNVDDLAPLHRLETLTVVDCAALTDLQGLSSLNMLTSLTLVGLVALESFESFPTLPTLRKLTITSNEQLTHLDGFVCEALQELSFENCDFVDASGLASLPNLRRLNFMRCKQLQQLPSMRAFPRLRELRLSNCDSIPAIQGLGHCAQLERLWLNNCRALESVDGLHDLPEACEIGLQRCPHLPRR